LLPDQNREAGEILFKEFWYSLAEFLLSYAAPYQFEKIILGGKLHHPQLDIAQIRSHF